MGGWVSGWMDEWVCGKLQSDEWPCLLGRWPRTRPPSAPQDKAPFPPLRRRRRDFFLSFAQDPAGFMQAVLAAQASELRVASTREGGCPGAAVDN